MGSINQTIEQLSEMRLFGFKEALLRQLDDQNYERLTFEERLCNLTQTEYIYRKNKKIERMQKNASLKIKSAAMSDVKYDSSRNLNRSVFMELGNFDWVKNHRNIIITGKTGTGKTWLSCALGNQAILAGFTVKFLRVSNLLIDLVSAQAMGSFLQHINRLSKNAIIILDDFGISNFNTKDELNLLELIESHTNNGSLIITSQPKVKEWYSFFKNPNIADAILDRIVHNSYRVDLEGSSLRKKKSDEKS